MPNFDVLENALLTVGPPVFHYTAYEQPDEYIVWAEDGQSDAVFADDRMTQQTITGTVDYFTKQEFDPNFELIQQALNSCGVGWRLESIQYEDNTKYIHYEWVFEIPQGVE